MLGECESWLDFLANDLQTLDALPRRNLRSGREDIKERLAPEIRAFCRQNFENMSENTLAQLYEDIGANRGLELPLSEFELRYAKVRDKVLRGFRRHCTVVLSLWGLQFRAPEDDLTRDLAAALRLCSDSEQRLDEFSLRKHAVIRPHREEIALAQSNLAFSSRSAVMIVFNLAEAYLNGLAWDYVKNNDVSTLSSKDRKLLQDSDGSLRVRLVRYPELLTGRTLWNEDDADIAAFVDIVKPYRDALVHPSPR